MLATTWDLCIWCNLDWNNVAPKCRVVSLQRLGTIPSIVKINHVHWWNNSHCAEATLKTSIIILVIDKHNKNLAMLAIQDNIIRYEKFIQYHNENSAKFGYLNNITPIIYKRMIPMAQSKYILATYSPKPGRVNKHRWFIIMLYSTCFCIQQV